MRDLNNTQQNYSCQTKKWDLKDTQQNYTVVAKRNKGPKDTKKNYTVVAKQNMGPKGHSTELYCSCQAK